MEQERRREERRRVMRRGKIVFRAGHGVIDCVLTNLSNTGACLRAPAMFVPHDFELRIDCGPRYEVETAHRTTDMLGVRFVNSIKA